MLVIHPDECIDCGVCEPECPAEAIHPESPELLKWVEMNREYSEKWPNITTQKSPPADADSWLGKKGKFEEHFSPKPGEGD